MLLIIKKLSSYFSVNGKLSIQLFILSVINLSMIFHFCSRRTDLLDLQQLVSSSATGQDTLTIVRKLEQYYLHLPIPDSISGQVAEEFRRLLQHSDLSEISIDPVDYRSAEIPFLDKEMCSLCSAAILAQVQMERSQFQKLLKQARLLAHHLDSVNGNHYWQDRLKHIQKFDLNQAQNWLRAQIAANYCYEFHNQTSTYKKSELFGAFALQLLASTGDPRLQLDVWQRIQVILYKFKGLYGLSFAVANVKIKESRAIHYVLREIGLTYNLANALGHIGQDQIVISQLNSLLKLVQRYPTMNEMFIYKKLISFSLASAYWQTAQYHQALQICQELENVTLTPEEKIELAICEGLNYHELGEYEKVELLYQNALKLARTEQDYSNLIVIYLNLSDYYNQFRQFKKSLLYCDSALTILNQRNDQNQTTRIITLQSKSNILFGLNRKDEIECLSHEIEKLVDRANIPVSKAGSLRLMAQTYLQIKNYEAARENFTKALQIYDEFHLIRPAIETRINLIKTLIQLSRLNEAQTFLNEVCQKADKMADEFVQIDGDGLQAEIAFKEKNLPKAIYYSNRVLSRVRNRLHVLQNLDNFAGFRQRVYHYLKKAAIYEIYAQRVDSAFCKLDFAKNTYVDMKLKTSNPSDPPGNQSTKFVTITELQNRIAPGKLLLNFLLYEDELHVFALNHNDFKLFSKTIQIDALQKATDNYLELIMNTNLVIQKNQKDKLVKFYQNVKMSGNKLYQFLFDWPQLAQLMENAQITYVIPDEKLYELPLATLPVMTGDKSQFLINETALINLPCSAALPETKEEKNIPASNLRIKYCADLSFRKAGELLRVIKSVFPNSEELSSPQATIMKYEILQQLNQGDDVYIFCGHSVSNSENPDLSTLTLEVLNTSASKRQQIQVTVNDFKKINWSSAKLVILLGCETAGKDEVLGTGLEGFQQVISSRGAENVIAALWKIEENQSISQIKHFLESWMKTQDIATAFHAMQIIAIQELENHKLFQKPHPFLWGAFTLAQATTHIKPLN